MVEAPNDFHPLDPQMTREPHASLAELRARCPVLHLDAGEFEPMYLFTRHVDISAILRDYRTFGSCGFFPSRVMHEATAMDRRAITSLDPPEHTSVRRLNLVAVKPAAVERAVAHIEQVARRIVDAFASRGHAELVHEWAVPLPADAIAVLLGLPESDSAMIHDWVDSQFSDAAIRASEHAGTSGSPHGPPSADFDEYLLDQIAARRAAREPVDDAITRMVQFEKTPGEFFTDRELTIHIRTLLLAGNETTTSLMSNAVYRLLERPERLTRVRADRELIPSAIEESLRFDTPITQLPRLCRRDAEISGVTLGHDAVVVLSTPSGNRDTEVWGTDADEFRVEDDTPDHLGFGLGIHHCVGSFLARTTARIGINALLDALDDLRLAPDYEYEKVYFFEFRRPTTLDVEFRATP
jgi:cytochrome P450